MSKPQSLRGRVAWAAAAAACGAALLAATATSLLAALLLQQAEDRRLQEAAVILAAELESASATPQDVQAIVLEEAKETDHMGMLFSVVSAEGLPLAGDARLKFTPDQACTFEEGGRLRLCWAPSKSGLRAIAGAGHTLPTSLLALSALLAAALAGLSAWWVSRPLSRAAVAPLARLRQEVSLLDIDANAPPALGPPEQVLEVDELRDTVSQLMARVTQSVEQARRFSANAAHELRTPLTAVQGELALLAEDKTLSPTSAKSVRHIEGKASELAALLEGLLILATPSAKPGDGTEVVSLRDLVEDTVAALPPSAQLRIASTEADALTRGDALLLAMMLSNALSNALKFGTQAEVRVAIDGKEAVLEIQDNGPGIAPADRERVFEPFFRTQAALKPHTPGQGLGLALVRHIATIHGGNATFLDSEKTGARLQLRLPLAAAAPQPS